MPFQTQSTALGKQAFFFREGDNITIPAAGSNAGAASRTNRPDATDPLYQQLQTVDDWEWDIKTMGDEKVYAPSPGRMQLFDIVEKGAEAMVKFSTNQIQGLSVEVFYRTYSAAGGGNKITSAGGVFVPLACKPQRGWLHTELYDNDNNFALSLDVYGLLRITGGIASKEGAILRPKFEFNMLYSALAAALANNS